MTATTVVIEAVAEDGSPIATFLSGYINDEQVYSESYVERHAVDVVLGADKIELYLESRDFRLRKMCVFGLAGNVRVFIPQIADAELNWPSVFLKLGDPPARLRAVKIGVVDCFPATPPPGLEHVDVVDWSGRVSDPSVSDQALEHGTNVCRLISGHGVSGALPQPIAPGSPVSVYPLYAVSLGVGQPDGITPDILAAAIAAAVADGCHVINISAGVRFDEDAGELDAVASFERVVALAEKSGCILVAAGGNRFEEQVRAPARLPEVYGVGMLGLKSSAAPHTYGEYLFEQASKDEEVERVGTHPQLGAVYVAGAVGEGLNLVFPGCSVYSMRADGEVSELTGSSFAAPIATGTLARVRALLPDEASLATLRTLVEALKYKLGSPDWFSTLSLEGTRR